MYYLFSQLWLYLLIAFIIGIVVGWVSYRPSDKRS